MLVEIAWLFNRNKNKDLTHLKNLIEMALADGMLHVSELDLLKSIARGYHIPEGIITRMCEKQDDIKFDIPTHEDEKLNQLYELVRMMTADETIDQEEMTLCKRIVAELGYSYKISKELIDSIIISIQSNYSRDEVISRVGPLLDRNLSV